MSVNKLNPFDLPGDWGPNVPLCPCEVTEHEKYYVPVSNTQDLFDEFTREMEKPTLERRGQLVLVTGESGCGKSALVNRCAWHVREKLAKVEVVDLRTSFYGLPALSTDDRVTRVANLLLARLDHARALMPGAVNDLAGHRDYPDEIYMNLPDALRDDQHVVVLLPTSDLSDEVRRYAALACPRVLFMIEFALLDEEDVQDMQRWAPPVFLRIDGLTPGDVRRYAADRLDRHSKVGTYPSMSEKTLKSAARRLRTLAHMQSTFHGVYLARLRSGRRYDSKSFVTAGDVDTYLLNGLQDGQGGRS